MTDHQKRILSFLASDTKAMSKKQGDMMRVIISSGFDDKLTDGLIKNLTDQQELCSEFYNEIDDLLDK